MCCDVDVSPLRVLFFCVSFYSLVCGPSSTVVFAAQERILSFSSSSFSFFPSGLLPQMTDFKRKRLALKEEARHTVDEQ